jgi:predicted CoA-binding protein
MNSIPELLKDENATVAVVGATDDPRKYGSVIYRDLKRKGFEVYPINPNRPTVDGDPTYPSLAALPVEPTIVNVVVPPATALEVLVGANSLGYRNVWLQPGAESPEALTYLQEEDFNYLANACIMVESQARLAR